MNTAVAEDFCQEKKAPLPPVAATFREGHSMEDEVGWDCVQTALCRQGLRGAEKPTHPMYLCHLPETVPEIPLLSGSIHPYPQLAPLSGFTANLTFKTNPVLSLGVFKKFEWGVEKALGTFAFS